MKQKDLLITENIQSRYLSKLLLKKFNKKFQSTLSEVDFEISSFQKTLNILNKNFKFNFKLSDLKRFKKFQKIALIGMGGSILGTEAICNFLQRKIKKKIYFFDDLDENKITNLKKRENLSKILFIIISKSGNTVETLSNTFSLKIIKKQAKNVIIISEKKNNFLFLISKKYNLFYVEHKKYIGGRYSVLSEVGLLPGYLMGINILKLRSNIQACLKKRERVFFKKNILKISNLLATKKLRNLIFINYAPELEKFLFWCQQLIAESLGKKNMGFLPVISNTPKDHHSLLQLYLDGPKDKFFNIFSIKQKSKEKINMGNIGFHNFLNKKKLDVIKYSQKQALIKSFKKNKIPFREFIIKSVDEKVLGKLFSFFILETVIAAKLLKINPFDQPAVEQVKVYTKNILS